MKRNAQQVMGAEMGHPFRSEPEKLHTCSIPRAEVWKLESRANAWSSIPSIPSIPVSSGAHGRARVHPCAHTHARPRTREHFGLEGMEGMEEGLFMRFFGFHTSAEGVEPVWKVWQ
jgi:hypothetical protein